MSRRISGLKVIFQRAKFETRLKIANSLYISRLFYLIQLWGGTSDKMIKALQVSQNKMARAVTRLSWFTPTRTLLKQCGWLSVRQLVVYHTALSTHKTVREGRPEFHFDKMCADHNYDTRNTVKFSDNFSAKSERAKSSYCYRGAILYNQLPYEIKQCQNISTFKKKLKAWVLNNIPI